MQPVADLVKYMLVASIRIAAEDQALSTLCRDHDFPEEAYKRWRRRLVTMSPGIKQSLATSVELGAIVIGKRRIPPIPAPHWRDAADVINVMAGHPLIGTKGKKA